jgi:hypothetical protein
MRRGPGRIERAIAAVLDEADAFTIEDLCQRIYGGTEKKHRVAVLRDPPGAQTTAGRALVAARCTGRPVRADRFDFFSLTGARARA